MSDIVAYYGPERAVWRCTRCVARAGFSDDRMRRAGARPITRGYVRATHHDVLCSVCWEYVCAGPSIIVGSRVGLVDEVAESVQKAAGAVFDGTALAVGATVGAGAIVAGAAVLTTAKVADAAVDVVTAPLKWLFD